MIEFLTGKPGDGKSLLATKLIVDDLVISSPTEPFVVTNVPLVLPALREYVIRKRGANAPGWDMDENLLVIPDSEVPEFYRFRSGGLVLEESPDRRERSGDANKRMGREEMQAVMKKEFMRIGAAGPAGMRPVHFYIDEAHNFFSSRDWATNGRGTLYYASQHRHLHDNVWLITQVMENVEKQLRSLVSETSVCRNYRRRSVGPFRMRPVFTVRSCYGVPSGNTEPFAKTSFYLDTKGLGACYRTTGALGVHRGAEKQKNKGFLPWWSAFAMGGVGVFLLALLCWKGPRFLVEKAMGHFLPTKPLQAAAAKVQAGGGGLKENPQKVPEESVADRQKTEDAEIYVYSGVSEVNEGTVSVYLPKFGEWFRAKMLATGLYKLRDGVYAKAETLDDRLARRALLNKETGSNDVARIKDR